MLDARVLDELASSLSKLLPPGVAAARAEIDDNARVALNGVLRSALSGAIDKMDLVTREEFDIQSQVLQKTRKRLVELEKRVADLENQTGAGV